MMHDQNLNITTGVILLVVVHACKVFSLSLIVARFCNEAGWIQGNVR